MLNFALLGSGAMGEAHLGGLASLENDCVNYLAVCDVDEAKAKAFAEKYGIPKIYTDINDMLADEEIDVVDLCLPSHMHEKFGIMVCNAKKHLLIEKPITFEVESAKRIYDCAKENGVRIMTAQVLRFWPEYKKIKELYETGALGEVKHIYAARLGQLPNWGGGWYSDPKKSGETMLNLTLHDIDFLHYMLGNPVSVYTAGVKDENNCYNDTMNIFKWANGINAIVDGSLSMTPGYPFTMHMRVSGKKATVEFKYTAGVNIGPDSAADLILYEEGKEPRKLEVDQKDGYGTEVIYFAKCIESGAETECVTEESILGVLRSIERAKESLAENVTKIID